MLNDGWRLVIVDDLNNFYSPDLKRANLEIVRSAGEFVFYGCNICDESAMTHIVSSHRPDVIVHLAARAGVRPSLAEPLLYEEVNVRGTMVMLEAARRYEVKKFVFASSSSIYGAANSVPFSEADFVNLPISPYAATKIAGEKICFTYSHLYGLATVCLRFFTVYGPRQRPDLAIRKFIEMIDAGETITVFGDGSTGRDYTYITDIVDGIVGSIDHTCTFETFNLGNSRPVTLNQMISTIEAAVGRKARVCTLPDQPGDVPITFADISKAERLLGYYPKVSFEEGIQRFVEAHLSRTGLVAHV
jgi:UDP-glucuronate 4-epimerase